MKLAFNQTMLLCHLTSCSSLFLYFHGWLTDRAAITLEVALLCVKTVFELLLVDFTKDLAAHHLCMLLGSYAVAAYHRDHAYLVVYCQTIHIPLALQYARRCSSRDAGSLAEALFPYAWCLIIGARNTMLSVASAGAIASSNSGLMLVLLPLATLICLLDVVWTREAFNKRRLTRLCVMSAAMGALLGAASGPFTSSSDKLARATWTFICGVTISVALFSLVLEHRGRGEALDLGLSTSKGPE